MVPFAPLVENVLVGWVCTIGFLWPFLTIYMGYAQFNSEPYQDRPELKCRNISICFVVLYLSFCYAYWYLTSPESYQIACIIGVMTFVVHIVIMCCICTCLGLWQCTGNCNTEEDEDDILIV